MRLAAIAVCTLIACALLAGISPASAQSRRGPVVTIAVSPSGDDAADGTADRPFRTLERAQRAAREVDGDNNVVVKLAQGSYRIDHPLIFRAVDGGQNGHTVTWSEAAPGAQPVISGGLAVTGWHLWNARRQIYVADVPRGLDARQLWVNDRLVPEASIELARKDWNFTRDGMVLRTGAKNPLGILQHANRLELRATGFFTERISPVERVAGDMLVMRQPAWDNNIWGYDTVEKPFGPQFSHLYLTNALELISQSGQWFLDPTQGKLYLRPPEGVDIATAHVELPRLPVLVSISGTLDDPVQDLSFIGIRFSYSSWLGPSSDEGYASQQSGTFLAGKAAAYPADPIGTCAQGCNKFESMRNQWQQMPAAVQVSAAKRIVFKDNIFAHLGQYALGIGNDPDATLSGVGLATGDITVVANLFTDIAGGAIVAGGVQADAHHPRDPRQTNRQIILRSNKIQAVSEDYLDNSAILSTYVLGAVILHNDISDVPYDAIDIGFGWGIQDPGGNPNYLFRLHTYDWKQNPIYQTPTAHRDVVVANNRIHGAKTYFHDGGAIYNLSASPGTLITENYIYDNHSMIGLYLDEGSRYITVRRNVVQDAGSEWLNVNTMHAAYPTRISPDNTAVDNWHDGTKIGGMWTNYQNDLILDDHLVKDNAWPAEAQEIMKNSGIEPTVALPIYPMQP
ncbi:MAG TPA: right-handed parallel beta-helix repeat-containing protein [Bryocella sp.]|nr:right-handed parallel beta-helix repeat-containing protein [Bryocella sp.]